MNYPKPLESVIEQLQKLPGIGAKTATRHTFALMKFAAEEAEALGAAISALHAALVTCETCCAIAASSPCDICNSTRRDASVICVVEETDDMWAIERTGIFTGTYHVLGGVLSPLDGVGPDELHIDALMRRLTDVTEVILAANPTTEGQSTTLYLTQLLEPHPLKVTQLAHGIPFGGDLGYVDAMTLTKALQGRREAQQQ